jgi:predicted DCC family thiol-disulfide oxidoreductase YuxK
MPSNKPLLIFDGDCGFCRRWINRWKTLTGDRVTYAPSQEVAHEYPDIAADEFRKSVQLIEPDGRRTSGAEAVFRTLVYGGSPGWLRAYERSRWFAGLSEFVYGIVAGNRPTFSNLTRWFWGNPATLSSYRHVRWIFMRLIAIVYAIAFWSYGNQIKGLNGSEGILPTHEFLTHLAGYGAVKYWYIPSLTWINSGDSFLVGLCAAGAVAAILLLVNFAPRWMLVLLWLLYLSVNSVGGYFMNFQWDALLLETGFLAIFFAPPGLVPQFHGSPSPLGAIVILLRWLLFRLMFQSALVKWLSGDALWRHFTALTIHYQTQPLPGPFSWYVHNWPPGFHKLSCLLMFAIEGLVPFLIFSPRRSRLFAFWVLTGFQGLIILTGNYTFFNVLTIALCVPLLDDAAVRSWGLWRCDEPLSQRPGPRLGFVCAAVGVLTIIPFGRVLGFRWPAPIMALEAAVSPIRSFNSYGLFAVMTPNRPEIILEGSNDGKNWEPYEFKYKPGDLARGPRQVAPFQPRLDWQMWFAALSDYRRNPWFINFCVRVLQGSKPVLALLGRNPFPARPPLYLRATVYDYRFTTPAERRQSGNWWVREYKGLYCPPMGLKRS